jgi:hypothetical protein
MESKFRMSLMVAILGDKMAASFPLNHHCQRVSGVYISYLCTSDRENGGKLQSKWYDVM